jgi:hypothetical protein
LYRKSKVTDTEVVAKVAEVVIKIRTIIRIRKEVISHIITIMIETGRATTKSNKLRMMLDLLRKEPNSNLLQFLRKKDQ